MPTSCECDRFPDIELAREAITKRARTTGAIRKRLQLVSEHPDREHKFYRCSQCNASWQLANAWNWGAKDYIFRVPSVEVGAWLQERFVDPDDLLIFIA